jgi:ribosomal protection tetracycline resistance protein
MRSGRLTPVLAGSAITGAGVRRLEGALADLAPRAADACGGAAAGSVFKVDRDGGTRRTRVRLWSGSVAPRDRLLGGGRREVVTEVRVSRQGALERAERARAGQVAVLAGLSSARVGDAFGPVPGRVVHHFPPPTRQAVVEPVDARRRTALFTALTELADTDPLIEGRVSEDDGEAAVSLHGEVHQEVLGSLLAETYAVPVRFRDLSTVCIERVTGTGEALDVIGIDDNPYLATIGLRVEARPVGHGLEFSPGIERGNLPPAFVAATEEGVRAAFRQGLSGWSVTDCLVTMTRSGYLPRQSAMHAGFAKSMSSVGADFRLLGRVVAMAALEEAGTRVCEPFERFDLEVPVDVLGAVVALVGTLGGHVEESSGGDGVVRLGGLLASARLPGLVRALPDLAAGEAVLTHRLDSHVPARGRPPIRRRHGVDPRDRQRWFREMPR